MPTTCRLNQLLNIYDEVFSGAAISDAAAICHKNVRKPMISLKRDLEAIVSLSRVRLRGLDRCELENDTNGTNLVLWGVVHEELCPF